MKTRLHSVSSSGDDVETKRASRRTVFTPKQLYYLEEKFVENQFPDVDQRESIASHVGLTVHHVQVRSDGVNFVQACACILSCTQCTYRKHNIIGH